MARYKSYDYAQAVMVAVSLEDQLEPGTLEHTIHYVVEKRLLVRPTVDSDPTTTGWPL